MALNFEETLDLLGTSTAGNLLHLLDLWQSDYISQATFKELAADTLDLATRQGTYYGQLSYAEIVALYHDTAPDYTGVIDPSEQAGQPREQLDKALQTLIDEEAGEGGDLDMRLERLGYSVAVDSVQDSYQRELQRDSEVSGWVRGLDAGACQLCQYWYRGGRIWPRDHPMPKHPGCKCQQVPDFSGDTPKDTRLLRDKRHREFIESLSPRELEYYRWAKAVRDEYAKALRTGVMYVDVASLPEPPPGVAAIVPPPNPKLTLRGIE